ncbi:MAG TPA: ComF family protein [Smithellaceae bacterium]|nr:ComF family protein [Smithellaceae bacterium]HRS88703.1 ComF family protein [Smithellaceae bacterium]HRV26731.1 ComF family protein [Smithellaceae bacterium]
MGVLKNIADIIFPPACLGCEEILAREEDKYFCPDCRRQIRFLTGSICPICGITFFDSPAENHLCGNCIEQKPFFSLARAVAAYESVMLEAIRKFKYGRDLSTGSLLASIMADFPFPDFDCRAYDMIVPVPLHIKKLRQRGFNQAVILAQALKKKWQIPLNYFLLKRTKFTLTQTGLRKKERENNIKGAFAVSDDKAAEGTNIILVDDVYTTGATVNECARTLRRAGSREIAVLTLARVI